MRVSAKLCMCVLLVLGHAAAWANTEPEGAIRENMVVTATRHASAMEAIPASVTVITREEILASAGTKVDEVLRRVVGVDVDRSDGIIGRSYVSLRGMGQSERTLILLDGHAMNKADTGSVNWEMIRKEDVERIEIVRGAASALYGTNAMGGVINIITRKSEDKPVTAEVRTQYGTNETWGAGGTISGSLDRFGYMVGFDHLESDGYNTMIESMRVVTDAERAMEEDHFRTRLTFDVNDRSTMSLSFVHDEDKRGMGENFYGIAGVDTLGLADPYGTFAERDTDRINFDYSWKSGDFDWVFKTYYSQEDYFRNREKGDADDPDPLTKFFVDVERIDTGAGLQVTFPVMDDTLLTTGVDFKYGSVDGLDDYLAEDGVLSTLEKNNQGKQQSWAAFLSSETPIGDRLVLNAGIRYDYTKAYDGSFKVTGADDAADNKTLDYEDESWDQISPKVALIYTPTESTSIRTSLGTGFRAPILDDQFRNGSKSKGTLLANPDLDPEKLISWELGVNQKFGKKLTVDLSGYYSEVEDFFYLIQITDTPMEFQVRNVGKVIIYGIELDADYALTPEINLFGNFTWNVSEIDEYDADLSLKKNSDIEGNKLSHTPEYKGNLGITYNNPEICKASLLARYVGKRYDDDRNEDELDAYVAVDLRIEREMCRYARLWFEVSDLFDEEYQTGDDSVSPGRFLMAGATFTF